MILKGSFDGWGEGLVMEKSPMGTFKFSLSLPVNVPVLFKFLVDGEWKASDAYPQVTDETGNVNNAVIPGFSPFPPSSDPPFLCQSPLSCFLALLKFSSEPVDLLHPCLFPFFLFRCLNFSLHSASRHLQGRRAIKERSSPCCRAN